MLRNPRFKPDRSGKSYYVNFEPLVELNTSPTYNERFPIFYFRDSYPFKKKIDEVYFWIDYKDHIIHKVLRTILRKYVYIDHYNEI